MAEGTGALFKKVDFGILGKKEGGQWTRGYIPLHGNAQYTGVSQWNEQSLPVQRSGVTIATGFDIGQWSVHDLAKLSISEALRAKLRPFTAPLVGRPAALKLQANQGLTISKMEADEIDAAVPKKVLADFVSAYEKERQRVGGKRPFVDLPEAICTAMFSFAYQYGADWGPSRKGTVDFAQAYWAHITSQDWRKAIAVLRSYSQHQRRRQHEADLIAKGVEQLK
jgi:hypothetical protein